MSSKIKSKPYIILILVTLILTSLALIYPSVSSKFEMGEAKSLNQDWDYLEDNNNELFDLPVDLFVPAGQIYTMSKELSSDFSESHYILIRSSLQDLTVKVDGIVIYQKIYQNNHSFPPYASMWHIIEIPANSDGKSIEIALTSPYQAMSGIVNDVFYGTQLDLYTHISSQYLFRLIIALFVLLGGLFMMASSLTVRVLRNNRNSYIGLFLVFISLWLIAESRMIQWFTGSQMIIGSLAYFMLPLFPIPILIYLGKYLITRFKTLYQTLVYLFIIDLFMVFCLHLFNVMDLFESVVITQILLITSIIIVIYTLIIEHKKYHNPNASKPLTLLSIMGFFGLIEFINFFINNFNTTSIFLHIGISIVFIIIMIDYVAYITSRLKISYTAEAYEKLAFLDQLTGGYNRSAYERDFDNVFSRLNNTEKIRLILFDFDDLKQINDTYGHIEGDNVLKSGFLMIQSIFEDLGICYRIGGDEFACVINNSEQNIYDEKIIMLSEAIKQENIQKKLKFNISTGTAVYESENDYKPSDLVKRADLDLYKNKEINKSNRLENDKLTQK